jgi:hypothetical protein
VVWLQPLAIGILFVFVINLEFFGAFKLTNWLNVYNRCEHIIILKSKILWDITYHSIPELVSSNFTQIVNLLQLLGIADTGSTVKKAVQLDIQAH